MEQRTIQFPRGRLTCTVRGGLAELCLEVRPDRPGLYRGLLKGPRGQVDLGLLLPEGGCLRLGRTVPVADLERKVCWPVTGAEAVLAHAFRQGGPSLPGWQRVRNPAARFPGRVPSGRPLGPPPPLSPGPGLLSGPGAGDGGAAVGGLSLFPGGPSHGRGALTTTPAVIILVPIKKLKSFL